MAVDERCRVRNARSRMTGPPLALIYFYFTLTISGTFSWDLAKLASPECSPSLGLYLCTNRRQCIHTVQTCNNVSDCEDNSDEGGQCSDKMQCTNLNCPHQCAPTPSGPVCICNKGWMMNNDTCVDFNECDIFKLCDRHCTNLQGTYECYCDDAYELQHDLHSCKARYPPMIAPASECLMSNGLHLCDNSTNCIEISKVCNHVHDCKDNSDELQCDEIRQCNLNCTYNCTVTPDGPRCTCDQGWKLENNTCVDINECNYYGICDQRCKNLRGSYECFCDDGYVLQDDKRTCKFAEGGAIIVSSNLWEIKVYNFSTGITSRIAESYSLRDSSYGIDFDGVYIYFISTSRREKFLTRVRASTLETQTVSLDGELARNSTEYRPMLYDNIAVDWITNNIYLTSFFSHSIDVCSWKSEISCATIANIHNPKNIAVNPAKRTLFWTDEHEIHTRVMSAGMDGSTPNRIYNFGFEDILDVTFDFHNDRMYWINRRRDYVESINLDGSQHRVLYVNILEGEINNIGYAVFEDKFYWSNMNEKRTITGSRKSINTVYSCNKFSGQNLTTVDTFEGLIVMSKMRIAHPSMQLKNVHNPCATGPCDADHICLLATSDLGFSCAKSHKIR